MANQSIKAAFEQFWRHVIARTGEMITQANSYTDGKTQEINANLTSHTGNTTAHITADERTKWNNAQPNQNAFSNVKVGTSTVAADSATDTLTIVAGNNVTITPDIDNDTITIDSTNTDTNVTQTATNSNDSYPLLLAPNGQTATTTTTSYFDSGVTLNPSTNTITANVSGSAASCTGNAETATTLTGLTATVDELNYVDGVTSNIQTQLDGKAGSDHIHTAEEVGAVQRSIFWYNPSEYPKLVSYIWSLIDRGYTSGVIQVEGDLTAPTDIPSDVVSKIGSYYICEFQKHGYGYVDAILSGDGMLMSYRNISMIDTDAWMHDWVESFNYSGYLPLNGNASSATTLSSTLPITKGGTGSTSRGEANQNLTCIGVNPITSTSNDTTTNWTAIGTGHCYYGTNGYLIGQPSQYGVLVNFVTVSEVFQLFNQQAHGGLNYRSGNYIGWNGETQTTNGWKKIYDTGNITKGTGALTAGSSSLANDYIYLQYE